MNIYLTLKIYLKVLVGSLISSDAIGWKVTLTIKLNDHVIWVHPNKVNMNEIDYGRWNEWDGLLTEGNEK